MNVNGINISNGNANHVEVVSTRICVCLWGLSGWTPTFLHRLFISFVEIFTLLLVLLSLCFFFRLCLLFHNVNCVYQQVIEPDTTQHNNNNNNKKFKKKNKDKHLVSILVPGIHQIVNIYDILVLF